MPYTWTIQSDHTGTTRRKLVLWPFRSLPKRGFAVVIMMVFTLITVPLYPLLGTVFVWGLLPFLMATVGALWWGLQRSYRDGEVTEELTLTPETASLRRTDKNGRVQEWDCNTYWTRVEMHQSGGPVPFYVTLTGNGRMVEIGAFLSEEERRTLYGELAEAVKEMRSTG